MLANGLNYPFDGHWWLVYPPRVILILTVVGFKLIDDTVHASRDVRLQLP